VHMPCEKMHMVQNYDNNILEGLAVATYPPVPKKTLNPLFLIWKDWQS
jgi:hypothetical protein